MPCDLRSPTESFNKILDRISHTESLRAVRSSVNAHCVTQCANPQHMDTPADRLRWARQHHHRKYAIASDAARAFGWKVSTYLGHENGDRNPSVAAAKKYARAYGVRWEWIYDGSGGPTQKALMAKLVGYVGAGSQAHFYRDGQISEPVELPPGGGISTVAVEVRGGSMRGIADSGWLIYYDDLRSPPTDDLIGKLCIVETEDGKVLIKVLQRGRRKGRFDLESTTESTMHDQRLAWAARVTWIKPR